MIEAKDMASQLIAAEEARTAISPFSDSHSDIDIDTADAGADFGVATTPVT